MHCTFADSDLGSNNILLLSSSHGLFVQSSAVCVFDLHKNCGVFARTPNINVINALLIWHLLD